MLLQLKCKACLLPASMWCSAHIMPSFHLSNTPILYAYVGLEAASIWPCLFLQDNDIG